jgi:hypothetical protein
MADLPKTQKPVIFLKKSPSEAEILAVGTLTNHLKSQNASPTIVMDSNPETEKTLKKLINDPKIKNVLPPKKYILTFKRNDSSIKNVQWQQSDEALNIFITLEKGQIPEKNPDMKSAGTDYDLAILPNVKKLEELGNIYEKNADFFKDIDLFSIGSDLNVGDSYQINSTNNPKLTTLSEQVFAAIEKQSVNEKVAQQLFSSIMMETKNLTTKLVSTQIYDNLKKLTEKGADNTKIDEIINIFSGNREEPESSKSSSKEDKDDDEITKELMEA